MAIFETAGAANTQRGRRFKAMLLATSLMAPAGALAQTVEEPTDVIIVTGTRASQLLALQRKRAAPSIIDVVSADLVGKLPDFNAAEAIQRLPGLSVEIDQGEGRYPVVRGIDSNLNNVTIDGNTVAAPEAGGRRVSLDVIPSDLVSAIEVIKAITPDLDANAVGGSINVVSYSAFDRKDPFLFVSARAGYNEKSGNIPFGGSIVHGTTFGADDQFGVVLAGSYFRRRYETNLVEGLDWVDVDGSGLFAPEDVRIFDYDITRVRWGLNLNLDYRPTDDRKFYVKSFFNEFTDEEARDQVDFNIQRGDLTVNSPTSISNSGGRAKREFRQNNQTQRIFNVSPGFDFTFGDLAWSSSYAFAYAEEVTPLRNDWEYRSGSNIVNTLDLSGEFFQLDTNALYSDPANFEFRRFFARTEDIQENLHSVRSDLQYDIGLGDALVSLKGGVKYTTRDKMRDVERARYDPVDDFTLADNNFALPGPENFHEGRYVFGPILDFAAHEAFFAANPGAFELNEEATLERAFNSDYEVDEDIYAGYLMASAEAGPLNLIVGFRIERTSASYSAFSVRDTDGDGDLEPEDITPISGETSYTHVLPSIHMKYAASDDLTIRAAWTNTIGRPNYEDVVPFFEEEDGEGEAGNPDLEAFESMGLDLSIEYYFQQTGIFSVGVFYKDIKNPIFTRRTDDIMFNGVMLDQLDQPENAESGELFGVEVNWQQQFEFLPQPLDGFGASANFTYVDSNVDVIGREADGLPFFRQSDIIYNVALYYAKGPFEARVAVTYRDDYLIAVGTSLDTDEYFDDRAKWDFKTSYNLTDNFTVFGTVKNFTDASRREYQGVSSRLLADEIYSWTGLFGVSANF